MLRTRFEPSASLTLVSFVNLLGIHKGVRAILPIQGAQPLTLPPTSAVLNTSQAWIHSTQTKTWTR